MWHKISSDAERGLLGKWLAYNTNIIHGYERQEKLRTRPKQGHMNEYTNMPQNHLHDLFTFWKAPQKPFSIIHF